MAVAGADGSPTRRADHRVLERDPYPVPDHACEVVEVTYRGNQSLELPLAAHVGKVLVHRGEAAAGCQPDVSDPKLEGVQFAQASAEIALKVVRLREHQRLDDNDLSEALITDAYATVAIAYRRASTVYKLDEEMQKLGTAAVHLLTMATSYMAAQSAEITPDG